MAATDSTHRPTDRHSEDVSDEDARRAWDAELDRELAALGLTMDELEAQAARCDFVSERARNTWFTFAPLPEPAAGLGPGSSRPR